MAYITSHDVPAPLPLLSAVRAKLSAARDSFVEYRRRREIYMRTLRELQAYSPHELADLRVQAGDIERLAREQAGW